VERFPKGLTNHLLACYRLAKEEPPQTFLDAIKQRDVAGVTDHIRKMLAPDFGVRMSEQLRRHCKCFLDQRSLTSALSGQQ